MPRNLRTGVPFFEHPTHDRLRHLNWEAIRVFLALGRTGSFRAAAVELGMALNTVRRYVDMLEKEVGAVLAKRGYEGVELTAEGRELRDAVRPMESAAFDVQRIAQRGFSPLSGFVRISVTEGIGTFWVMPRLVDFQRANPKMIIELNCTMRPPDLVKMEADIGIQIARPTDPEVKTIKLGRMHAMFFAARSYSDTYGRPRTLDEMRTHKVVEQVSPQVRHDEYERIFPGQSREGFVAIATNTSTAHYWAVAKGAGIGMLPTYLWAIGARVEPTDVDYHLSYDIWLAYHPDSKRNRRIAATIEWLRRLFDAKEFPWFRDEFMRPEEFAEAAESSKVRELFDVFAGSVRDRVSGDGVAGGVGRS
jgi:DNA-binding transcriptional LysR family regulator